MPAGNDIEIARHGSRRLQVPAQGWIRTVSPTDYRREVARDGWGAFACAPLRESVPRWKCPRPRPLSTGRRVGGDAAGSSLGPRTGGIVSVRRAGRRRRATARVPDAGPTAKVRGYSSMSRLIDPNASGLARAGELVGAAGFETTTTSPAVWPVASAGVRGHSGCAGRPFRRGRASGRVRPDWYPRWYHEPPPVAVRSCQDGADSRRA